MGGQRVEWIKMKLGMEVGLGPGHTGRWIPSSPLKGHSSSPLFTVAKRSLIVAVAEHLLLGEEAVFLRVLETLYGAFERCLRVWL